MAGGGLFGWVKHSVTKLIDPGRDERLNAHAVSLHRELIRERKEFNAQSAAAKYEIDPAELGEALERVYQRCMDKAWSDLELTENEGKSLDWIAGQLQLSTAAKDRLERAKCLEVFETVFARVIEDGHVDEAERQNLESIATRCKTPVATLVRTLFHDQGEAFLRNAFVTLVDDGRVHEQSWTRLTESASRLGITRGDLLAAIERPAHQYVEHVLADFKSDGEITSAEESAITWLLKNLVTDAAFRVYVNEQLQETKLYAGIAKGRLPVINSPAGIELRAGEIPHFAGNVQYVTTRELKSGPKTDVLDGTAIITDSRFIFSAPQQAFQINHRQIIESRIHNHGLEVRSQGKGAGNYGFKDQNRLAISIWRAAIGRANQTIVEESSGADSRHIPRDVRQRVWQRYGGKCVECSSDQYLEYDHIIPHAKGGSNADNNVQLLCRKCNLSKSDRI